MMKQSKPGPRKPRSLAAGVAAAAVALAMVSSPSFATGPVTLGFGMNNQGTLDDRQVYGTSVTIENIDLLSGQFGVLNCFCRAITRIQEFALGTENAAIYLP